MTPNNLKWYSTMSLYLTEDCQEYLAILYKFTLYLEGMSTLHEPSLNFC